MLIKGPKVMEDEIARVALVVYANEVAKHIAVWNGGCAFRLRLGMN